MQDSERARALEQAREWQAIAYGDRPETWAALDYYRELGWPVDSNKFPEREPVEGRIFAFMSGYREALKAAVDPPPSGASSVDAPIYRQVYIVTHYPEGGLRGVHASQAGAEAEIAELCREYPDYTRQDFSIVCDRIRPSPPSGASPQATGGYIHHSLTDWIPTPGCDCDRCTSARKSARKPTGGASPQADATCEHGTAMDVHCCHCHSGFIFDVNHECPASELTWREAVEQALGVENDTENHSPSWAFDVVRAAREIGNAPTSASPQAETSDSIKRLDTEHGRAHWAHVAAVVARRHPAPVSPVEPTTCPKCRSNTRAYRLAVADVIDGRMAGMTSCRDEWHSRMPMVSPVEPEPPTGVR